MRPDTVLTLCFQRITTGKTIAIRRKQKEAVGTFTLTFRIHRQAIAEDRVLLRVSGWITGDKVNTLGSLLEQEKSSGLILDLKDVRLADSEAVKLLAIYESKGARIDNCPLYIQERIRREREAT